MTKAWEKCITLIKKELEAAVTKDFCAHYCYKTIDRTAAVGNDDNAESQCLTMGKSLLVSGKIRPLKRLCPSNKCGNAGENQSVAKEVLKWNHVHAGV